MPETLVMQYVTGWTKSKEIGKEMCKNFIILIRM